jgi:hypothetical protein
MDRKKERKKYIYIERESEMVCYVGEAKEKNE